MPTAEVAVSGNAVTLNAVIKFLFNHCPDLLKPNSCCFFFRASEQTFTLRQGIHADHFNGEWINMIPWIERQPACAVTLKGHVSHPYRRSSQSCPGSDAYFWFTRASAEGAATVLWPKQWPLHLVASLFPGDFLCILRKGHLPSVKECLKYYFRGLAPFLMNVVNSLVINIIKPLPLNSEAIMPLSVMALLTAWFFFFMIMFGFNQGMQPLVDF